MSAYREAVLATAGIVSLWGVDEAEGSAADSKGSNTGTYQGNPSRHQASILPNGEGFCVDLTPATQFVNVPHAASLNLGDIFTLEAWIRPDIVTGNRGIISKGGGAYYLRMKADRLQLIRSQTAEIVASTNTLSAGTPYHVVATKTGSTVKLYVNGVDVTGTVSNSTCANNSNALNIGGDTNFSTERFDGKIQYAAVYNVALTAEQVASHYTAAHQGAPDVVTQAATGVGIDEATLNGTVNPNGTATTAWFEYGETEALGTKVAEAGAGEGEAPAAKSHKLEGLAPGTKYFFRVAASNAHGEDQGAILSFTTEAEPPAEGAPRRVAVDREYPPDDLAWYIERPGAPRRWAADEVEPGDLIEDCSFSTQMDGGFKEASTELPRDHRREHRDLDPYTPFSIQRRGGTRVFEGRLEKPSGIRGERQGIRIEGAGWAVALEDNRGILDLGFINSDLSKWGEPGTQRRLNLLNASHHLVGTSSVGRSSQDPEAVSAAIVHDFMNTDGREGRTERAESVFLSEIDIGAVLYDFQELTTLGSNTNWTNRIELALDAVWSSHEDGTDHNGVTALQQSLVAPGPGYKAAAVVDFINNIGTIHRTFAWQPKILSLLATENLTLQGTWPDVGYTAAQMLGYVIPRYAAPLRIDLELLEDDGFVIGHAWPERGGLPSFIEEITRYGLLNWFVYFDQLFQLRRPGTFGKTWKAYTATGFEGDAGPDAQRLWESMCVAWPDVDGTMKTAGPPGSGAMFEAEGLRITDPEHPAVAYEGTRQDMLVLQDVCTPGPAIAAAERFLTEANELPSADKVTFTGHVLDDKGVPWPVSEIRSGDYVDRADAPHQSRLRKVTATNYQHKGLQCSADLDAPAGDVKALLERYGAALRRLNFA